MTSVKEFRVEREPTPDRLGRGAFVFTDDYSVFDWGKMPDSVPNKGASLCVTGAATFEHLEGRVPTHYRGVYAGGAVRSLARVAEPPREMAIDLVDVPTLPRTESDGSEYDYEAFHAAAGSSYLIPLEIVFRNAVPPGSSLRDRTTPAALGLDLDPDAESVDEGESESENEDGDAWPSGTVELDDPVIEFSTKFESTDRYLDATEAARIAGAASLETLRETARAVNAAVTERAAAAGLTHQDGKIECLYHDGEVRVADVAGTFDENRFTYEGRQVSKEVLRRLHRRRQAEWVAAVKTAKRAAREAGTTDWRERCTVTPEPLPAHVIDAVRDLYTAGANAYADRNLFDAPSLATALDRLPGE